MFQKISLAVAAALLAAAAPTQSHAQDQTGPAPVSFSTAMCDEIVDAEGNRPDWADQAAMIDLIALPPEDVGEVQCYFEQDGDTTAWRIDQQVAAFEGVWLSYGRDDLRLWQQFEDDRRQTLARCDTAAAGYLCGVDITIRYGLLAYAGFTPDGSLRNAYMLVYPEGLLELGHRDNPEDVAFAQEAFFSAPVEARRVSLSADAGLDWVHLVPDEAGEIYTLPGDINVGQWALEAWRAEADWQLQVMVRGDDGEYRGMTMPIAQGLVAQSVQDLLRMQAILSGGES